MTNEEKARELAMKYTTHDDEKGKKVYSVGCEVACNEMAAWKDRQIYDLFEGIMAKAKRKGLNSMYKTFEELTNSLPLFGIEKGGEQ